MQLKQNQVLNSSTSLAMVPWRVLPVIIAGIAIGIFILDTFTHPEILVAMLYVGVVLLSARFLPKRGVILVSLGCMALAVLSYFLVQHGASPAAALANRLLSLAAIGITAFFAVQSRSREMVLSEQAGLLDLSHDTIFVRDMTDVITYWNSGAEELYGWKKEEAIGKVTHQLMQTIFPEPLEEITAVLLRTGRWEGELVHTKKDGTQATVASRWSVQLDALGNPAAILETNNDITERKRAEEAARRSEEELRQVIETVPAMVWTALPDGNVDFISQRWQEFTDLSPEESLGWDWGAAVHPEDREQHESKWRASLATGQTFSAEMRLCRPTDGEYRWFLDSAVPLRDEHGNILKWYGFVVDIDDRKRAEEALQKVQAELAHVARVTTMGALTSSIAHEVNQPLGAIVTNANAALRWLAGQPPNIDEARETLGRIVRDGHRAGEVIGRVRALLKKTATVRARVDLNGLIEDAARSPPRRAAPPSHPAADRVGARPAARGGRPGAVAAGDPQPDDERHRGDEGGDGPAARAADCLPARGLRGGVGRGEGRRHWSRSARCGTRLRAVLHDESGGPRHGPGDLPVDHRGAWGTVVGKRQ